MSLREEWRTLLLAKMEEQGINQAELARRLGVKSPTVSRYLSGKTCPGVAIMERWFNVIGFQPHFELQRDVR